MAHERLINTILERILETGADLQWCAEYAEPGYAAPAGGILFANWNGKKLSQLARVIDKCGVPITTEWSDEWSTCEDCGRAVRTSPDSYAWLAKFVILDGCSLVCHKCVLDNMDVYEEHLLNDPWRADVLDVDWSARGFVKLGGKFESGWHPGQTDDPQMIAKGFRREYPGRDFLFQVTGKGQFDVRFVLWYREAY